MTILFGAAEWPQSQFKKGHLVCMMCAITDPAHCIAYTCAKVHSEWVDLREQLWDAAAEAYCTALLWAVIDGNCRFGVGSWRFSNFWIWFFLAHFAKDKLFTEFVLRNKKVIFVQHYFSQESISWGFWPRILPFTWIFEPVILIKLNSNKKT